MQVKKQKLELDMEQQTGSKWVKEYVKAEYCHPAFPFYCFPLFLCLDHWGSSHVWVWELDYKERWALKNWCFWTVVLEKTLENLLDCREIQPVHPKENQSWIFIGRTDAEAEALILWPPNANNCLTWKDPGAGEDWRWEEKRKTEDEMVGWRHWINGHEFEYTLEAGDGQGGLACCSPWGHKEADMTEQLNWTELKVTMQMMIRWPVFLVVHSETQPWNLMILCHLFFFLSFPSFLILSSPPHFLS